MKPPTLVTGVAIALCLVALWAVNVQGRRRAELQTHQTDLLANLAKLSETSSSAQEQADTHTAPLDPSSTSELLRLRSEVTRLTEQQRSLATARTEHDRLQAQLAARSTNSTTRPALPPGYVSKTDARMVGFNSPENTVQSMLWALQNHDFSTFMQAFTPEAAEKLMANLPQSNQDPLSPEQAVFREAEKVLGLGVVDQHPTNDGTIEAKLQMVPTNPAQSEPPETMRFQQIDGQWKIAGPF